MIDHDDGDEDRRPIDLDFLDAMVLGELLAPRESRLVTERMLEERVSFEERIIARMPTPADSPSAPRLAKLRALHRLLDELSFEIASSL